MVIHTAIWWYIRLQCDTQCADIKEIFFENQGIKITFYESSCQEIVLTGYFYRT